MSSNPVGIAILGAGIFAKEAYIPALLAQEASTFVLKAVYSRSQKSSQGLADAASAALKLDSAPEVYYDADPSKNLDSLLARSDIAAVIIVLPISLQPSIVLKSLEHGKHVLSEKPVAPDVQGGHKLIRTYREKYEPKGLVWRIAENYEAEPVYRAAREAILADKIGKVQFFRATVYNYIDKESKWYNTPWRTVPDYQGGFLLDGGVHTAAVLRTLLPERLTHLSAFASLNKDYLEPTDTINVIAKAGAYFHGLVEMTFASPTETTPKTYDFVITGNKGWLSLDKVEVSRAQVIRLTTRTLVKVEGKPAEEKEEIITGKPQGVGLEVKYLLNAIAGNPGEGLGDPSEALRDVAFIEAALGSDGQLINLEAMA